jgi:hypothetical protein
MLRRGSKKPLSSSIPDVNIQKPRLPTGGNVRSPNAPDLVKPSKPKTPKDPVVKPNKPPSVDPVNPVKPPSMLDRAGGALGGLASGAGMIGLGALATGGAGGGLGGLFGAGIQTAGNVVIADKAIEAVKDVINNITDSVTENPLNLAVVVGVLGVVLFGIPKFK